jgi:phospholipid/cholesterol/gamma-HCH transport system substrate-binding protein
MSKEQKVGLFFLLGVFLAAVAVEVTVGTGLFTKRYPLYADYHDVEGLKVGDPVRIAGVQMGRVDQIAVTAENVRVRMQVNTAGQVRRNSVARLDFQALSGSRFIAISLGSPDQPVLHPGDTVQSEQGMSITDMLDQFDGVGKSITELADSFNRNQDELLRNLNTLIADNQDSIRGVLASLDSITNKLNQGQGTLAKLINDPGLYDQVERLLRDADTVMRDLQHVSTRLAQGKGSLGRLVAEDGLYDDLQETLASLNNTARNLEELSDGIRDGQGTLGRLVTDDSLYLEAQQAVRGLDRAATGIEDQAPISVLATFVSTLF